MNTEVADTTNLSEKKDFLVNSSSLKDVRSFSREVFEKFKINEELREELVLAIAEATQNIVGYKFENPSVVFKKPFAAMPNMIAKAKYI